MSPFIGEASAGWRWLPREQVTRAGSSSLPGHLGAATDEGVAGRTSGILWHQMVRVWDQMDVGHGANHGFGYYVPIGPDWTPTQAWNDDLEAITDSALGQHSTDLSIAVDGSDSVFLTAEIFHWRSNLGDGTQPRIGYRHRTASGWTPLHIISPDSLDYGANTPTLFLQEGAGGDSLHVIFNHGGATQTGMWHTRKATADAENEWEAATFVTATVGSGNGLRVDGSGRVHFFGRQKFSGTSIDSSYFWHFSGYPPGGAGAWDLDSTIVSRHVFGVTQQGLGPEDPPTLQVGGAGGGLFDWVWAEDSTAAGAAERVVFYSHGDSTNAWTPRIALTSFDGSSSWFPAGTRSDNGMYHVVYNEPRRSPSLDTVPTSADETRLFHIFSANPTDAGSWSRPVEASTEQRTLSIRPRLIAVQDTLWMLFTSHDDDDPTPGSDGDYEVWAQKGHAMADTLKSTNETWSGSVYLDHDFEVQAGKTLTIAPGTRVFAAASTGTEKVELIILGQLIAVGEEGNPIVFSSYGGSGVAGEWGGILFDLADASQSTLECCEISGATKGLRFAVVAPTLRHLTFSDNEVADIFLGQDTRIAAGSEWLLDAPTRVVVFDAFALDDSLGTPGVNDLLVLGSLVTERPPSAAPEDSVVFESVSRDSANGDDWGGISIVAGGTGLLHDCDIGFGLRGVYFAAADSAELVDSHVHHYSEEGVFDYASDALIQGCTIERGDGLDPLVETTAIRGKLSVPWIEGNQIGWQTEFGIWVYFDKSWCQASLPFAVEDTVRILSNEITEDGGATDRPGSAAIRGEYLCQHHSAEIDTNTVTGWNGRAVDLYQSADVHLECNRIEDNFAGVEYFRDAVVLQSFEGDVYWKGNTLKRSKSDNVLVTGLTALRIYDAAGGGQAAGQNSLQRQYSEPDSRNVRLDVKGVADTLDVRHQSWFDGFGLMTDTTEVKATNDPGKTGVILVDPLLSSEQVCSGGSVAAQGGRAEEFDGDAPERSATAVAERSGVPDRWSIEVAGRNPSPGHVTVMLAVPRPSPVRAVVYDVTGRRVRVVQDGALDPGFHVLTWDRSRDGGGRVAPGVYFLRIEGLGFRATRKVVLLPSGG